MDYSSLKFFSLKYSLFSEYYKQNLHNLLDKCFNDLPSYELHNDTIIQGFTKNKEIISTLSLLNHTLLQKILKENNNDDMSGYSKKGDNGLFIYNIATSPEYQRNRLGEVLIHKLMKETTANYLQCQVKKDNEPSFNLFFKCGFQIEEEMMNEDNLVVCVLSKDT